ncbi:helix-turn-helix domain-containing protein, partial [Bacillus cereus]
MYQRPIREGFTLSKIYHETGIPKSALYEELNKRGIEVRKGNRKSYTKKSMETTIFMYQNRKKLGMTVKEIVKETGVCINALNEELNKRGLVEGNRVYPVKLVNQAIELIISRRNAYSVPQV